MLYFVKPLGVLEWTANVGQELIDIARANRRDLGEFTEWWQAAERPANDDDVRVALRHGLAASGGIIVDAGHIVTVQRPSTLRALAAQSAVTTAAYNVNPAVVFIDDRLEELAPGWKEHGLQLDKDVTASIRDSLRAAEADAAHELATDVDDDLRRHWFLAGGQLPDPT